MELALGMNAIIVDVIYAPRLTLNDIDFIYSTAKN